MTRLAWICTWLCSSGCVITSDTDPACGDGRRESVEECDDGNLQDGDGCTSTCTFEPYCGDAVMDAGEECDDGNNAGGDGCSAACLIEPFCGDGMTDVANGETCDDGARVPSDGCSSECLIETTFATTANWTFSTVAAQMVALPCPAGFDTMQVHSQALDTNDAPIGAPLVDLFTCSAGTGTIAPVFEGRYRTFLAVTNTNGTQTYATTPSLIVDLTNGNRTFTAKVFTDGGYFKLAWNLIGAVSNLPTDCAAVGASTVSLLATVVATPSSFTEDLFTCSDQDGLTAVLPADTYTISVSALDGAGGALGVAPTLVDRTIEGPNKVTDLGTITIPIDGM